MKYLFIFIILIFTSCDYRSSTWEYVHEEPNFADFIGEWKIIEPTYKNLEEDFGLKITRKAILIIREDSTIVLKDMPAVFDFTKVYNPVHYFNTEGTCSFAISQGVWWIYFHLNKNEDVTEVNSANIQILRNKKDSKLRLIYRGIFEKAIVFEKVK